MVFGEIGMSKHNVRQAATPEMCAIKIIIMLFFNLPKMSCTPTQQHTLRAVYTYINMAKRKTKTRPEGRISEDEAGTGEANGGQL